MRMMSRVPFGLLPSLSHFTCTLSAVNCEILFFLVAVILCLSKFHVLSPKQK